MSGAQIQKENPGAGPGLPNRLGDANCGATIVPHDPAAAQPPDDAVARFWFSMGRAAAILDRIEARLGIARGGAR